MAKKRATIKVKKRKKKWFKVLAPGSYGSKEIGEVTAFEGKDLLGRTLEISSRDVGSRENAKKIVFRITKVTGETAETTISRVFLMDNSVQKKSRKIKEKIVSVFKIKMGSGQELKFKILLNANNHITNSTRSSLINALPMIIENELKKKSVEDVFAAGYTTKLSLELKKRLKTIYPVSTVFVWKVSLV